jgi:hypothetical protein
MEEVMVGIVEDMVRVTEGVMEDIVRVMGD